MPELFHSDIYLCNEIQGSFLFSFFFYDVLHSVLSVTLKSITLLALVYPLDRTCQQC